MPRSLQQRGHTRRLPAADAIIDAFRPEDALKQCVEQYFVGVDSFVRNAFWHWSFAQVRVSYGTVST